MKPKINIGLLRRLQPTKLLVQKAGQARVRSVVAIRRQEGGRPSRRRWNLQYLYAPRNSKRRKRKFQGDQG